MPKYTIRGQGEDQGDPLFFMEINGDALTDGLSLVPSVVEAIRDTVAAQPAILETEVIKYTTTIAEEVVPPTP